MRLRLLHFIEGRHENNEAKFSIIKIKNQNK
jgi:hypothetical protein